jgi:hypothetical protein
MTTHESNKSGRRDWNDGVLQLRNGFLPCAGC